MLAELSQFNVCAIDTIDLFHDVHEINVVGNPVGRRTVRIDLGKKYAHELARRRIYSSGYCGYDDLIPKQSMKPFEVHPE